MHHAHLSKPTKLTGVAVGLASLLLSASFTLAQQPGAAVPDLNFLGVAAGDASTSDVVLWTRALDTNSPVATALNAVVATDTNFTSGVLAFPVSTDATKDYTAKVIASNLVAGTRYYYRFVNPANPANASIIGTFKTAPAANAAVAVKFGFSGDNDGLMRPYALASTLPAAALDFYVNLGDVIYENASNVRGNIGQSYTNSPSVTLSGDSASKNGVPVGGTTFATRAQLKADYEKKYRENFLPVNLGGQNCLQDLYRAQGNYTTWDNHELGNRQYINGGAAPGGSVGGPAGNDMPTGRGVDARDNGAGNIGNTNDVNTTGDFMNRSIGFQTLQNVFLSYQPIADRGFINAPADSRSDSTPPLFLARQWGQNAIYINTDTRSYRDLRLKTTNGAADDTGPRAANTNRTMLGATQLAWLKQTLLTAQTAGISWKFVSVSDPLDQLGPIAGTLAVSNTITSVNNDGGKSWMGGYRAERNDLLKFIADNGIKNVVFLATDDHQNRVNELLYSPTGQTENQASYVRVPHCFTIVDGPLGATGPDTITDHSFSNIQAIASGLANAQSAAGLDPVGLDPAYPGLFNVVREGDAGADTTRQPIDFYSPDTFNYTTLEVSADGKTLTVKSVGINSTTQNSASEYSTNNPAREILSFQIDANPEPAFTSCPGALVVTNDAGQCSALVTLPVAASGRPAPVVTCTIGGNVIDSPFTFPKGTTAVNCTASNYLGIATCSFTVTVVDGEAPVASAVRTRPSRGGEREGKGEREESGDDVYYVLQASDNCDSSNLQIYVKDSAQGDCGGAFAAGPYAPGTKVSLARVGSKPSVKRGEDGVAAKIKTVGNPVLVVTDASGNTACVRISVPKKD